MKITTFSISLFAGIFLSACSSVVTEDTDESEVSASWETFENEEIGVQFRYPPELEWTLSEREISGIDIGLMRRYNFSGLVEGVDVSFSIQATSEDFGLGISEGCCWYYSGPALNLDQTNEEIMDDLTEETENEKIVGDYTGKFLKAYNLEKLSFGSKQVARFTSLGVFVGYMLKDMYLIPNPDGDFTNFVITWRGKTFTNLEGEMPYDDFFRQVEEFASGWPDTLNTSEQQEKDVIEKIIQSIEFEVS